MTLSKSILQIILLVSISLSVNAVEYSVNQKAKKFSISHLKAKVGDTIVFQNNDPFHHNIYSLSTTQSFDLGAFRKGETRSLILMEPGKIGVKCVIHPFMNMEIVVE